MTFTPTAPWASALACALACSGIATATAQTCNPSIPLTRPDSRYEAVAGATPAGSEVRDKVTGLVWQRCVQGMVWNGSTCTGTATAHTWPQALELARSATASTAAGASAWRLPNHAELFSLAERACYNPAINTSWFPATPTSNSWTWSSSPLAHYSDDAWSVYFYGGNDLYDLEIVAARVRLVRSGQ